MTRTIWSKPVPLGPVIVTIAALFVAVVGIKHLGWRHPVGVVRSNLSPVQDLADSVQDDAPSYADFSRPFNLFAGYMEPWGADGSPVSTASEFANSAGGTWVVFAERPLESVKGIESFSPYSVSPLQNSPNVRFVIDRVRKKGTPIAYDTTHGYVFMVFGDKAELAKLRAAPPDRINGFYLRGNNLKSALAALSDAFHKQISIDGQVGNAWTAYRARSAQIRESLAQSQIDGYAGKAAVEMMPGDFAVHTRFEFSNVSTVSEANLIDEVAKVIGGVGVQTADGQWRISALTSGPALNAELKRLKSAIDEPGAFYEYTSGGDRKSWPFPSVERQTVISIQPPPIEPLDNNLQETVQFVRDRVSKLASANSSVTAAMDELGVIGTPALTVLTSHLKTSAPLDDDCSAMRVLASETPGNIGARKALYKYIDSVVATPAKPGKEADRISVIVVGLDLLSAMGKADGSLDQAAQDVLNRAASSDLPQYLRTQASFTLLRFGIVPSLQGPPPVWNPASEFAFVLTPPPGGHGLLLPITTTPSDAIHPLASVSLRNGDTWAVFDSGRFGNARDLWLAHASAGVWREFLFTGKQYQSAQGDAFDEVTPIQPGGCRISVTGDRVVIWPARVQAVDRLTTIQVTIWKQDNQSETNKTVQDLDAKYSRVAQAAGSSLSATYALSLAELRKDTDGDGLTDVVEQRFETDPTKSDTMNNGAPDGRDQNPLVKTDATKAGDSDRREILQQVFSALYGSGSSVSPIVVVLDKPLQQQFKGGAARILCMSPKDYAQGSERYSALRCLQFGGPTGETSTILNADGPCLFSDDRKRAEVHFWTTTETQQMNDSIGQQAKDYVAIFELSGSGWTLKSIDNWQFRFSNSSFVTGE